VNTTTSDLRHLRREAYRVFDPLWKKQVTSRRSAYEMLAKLLELPLQGGVR
jgi:hypothetical protein